MMQKSTKLTQSAKVFLFAIFFALPLNLLSLKDQVESLTDRYPESETLLALWKGISKATTMPLYKGIQRSKAYSHNLASNTFETKKTTKIARQVTEPKEKITFFKKWSHNELQEIKDQLSLKGLFRNKSQITKPAQFEKKVAIPPSKKTLKENVIIKAVLKPANAGKNAAMVVSEPVKDHFLAMRKPSKVLLVGDSLMGGIASSLGKKFRSLDKGSKVKSMWKISSGLVVKKFYDWSKELNTLSVYQRFDLSVVFFGANDDKPIRKQNKVIRFKDENWSQEYLGRVQEVADILCKRSKKVIWLGVPSIRRQTLNTKLKKINSVFQQASRLNPCLEYIETAPIVGLGEKYSSYTKVGSQLIKTRASDGIHINSKGGKLIADKIVESLKFHKAH